MGRCSSSPRAARTKPKSANNIKLKKKKNLDEVGFTFQSRLKMLFGWTALCRGGHIPRGSNHLLGIPQNSSDNEIFQEGH